jgi:hypothetical protein
MLPRSGILRLRVLAVILYKPPEDGRTKWRIETETKENYCAECRSY